MIGTGGRSEFGLLGRADGGEDLGAEPLRDLDQQEPDAAGAGVDQAPIARCERERIGREEVRRHALQRNRGSDVPGDVLGHQHQLVGGERDPFGVRPGTGRPRHPVADREALDAVADRDHGAGTFEPEDVRQLHLVEPRPLIRVDEVQAGRADLGDDLSGAGVRLRQLPPPHHVRAALFVDLDAPHVAEPTRSSSSRQPVGSATRNRPSTNAASRGAWVSRRR